MKGSIAFTQLAKTEAAIARGLCGLTPSVVSFLGLLEFEMDLFAALFVAQG